ncbi:MAG: hypothetical protein AMXMBFR82_07180 [Candidatus Hydrogenedentota bacterium]
MLTDGQGIPLTFTIAGANRHDGRNLLPLVDAIPPIKGKTRPSQAPSLRADADRAYSQPHSDNFLGKPYEHAPPAVTLTMAAASVFFAGSPNVS